MAQSKNRKIVVSNGFHTLDDQLHDLAMTGEQHRGTADQNALLRHGTHPKKKPDPPLLELRHRRGGPEVAPGLFDRPRFVAPLRMENNFDVERRGEVTD